MNSIGLTILTILLITIIVKGENISIPTDFTKSTIEKYNNETKIKCETNEDCPNGLECYTSRKYCIVSEILCSENESVKCLGFNITMWDTTNEELYEKYRGIFHSKVYKPIIKTCEKDDKSCKTDECDNNEDCYSGLCEFKRCVYSEPLYLCYHPTPLDLDSLTCKKMANMKCSSIEECARGTCNDNGYCENDKMIRTNNGFFVITVVPIIVIVIIILGCIGCCCCFFKKNSKN